MGKERTGDLIIRITDGEESFSSTFGFTYEEGENLDTLRKKLTARCMEVPLKDVPVAMVKYFFEKAPDCSPFKNRSSRSKTGNKSGWNIKRGEKD